MAIVNFNTPLTDDIVGESMNSLFRIEEACCALGISHGTLYTLIKRGDIKPVKLGGQTRISEDEILRFIEKQGNKTINEPSRATNERRAQPTDQNREAQYG